MLRRPSRVCPVLVKNAPGWRRCAERRRGGEGRGGRGKSLARRSLQPLLERGYQHLWHAHRGVKHTHPWDECEVSDVIDTMVSASILLLFSLLLLLPPTFLRLRWFSIPPVRHPHPPHFACRPGTDVEKRLDRFSPCMGALQPPLRQFDPRERFQAGQDRHPNRPRRHARIRSAQHSTAQSTAQHSTAQHSTARI